MNTKPKTNMRMTSNREVVLDVLRKARSHPTAQQVFLAAREQQPQIGFATVYRTLDWLRKQGLVQEIFRDKDGAARYDANVTRHDHAICNGCGRIEDISVPLDPSAYSLVERRVGFRINRHTTAVTGLCADCAASRP